MEARSAISRWRSTAAATVERISQSRCSLSRSLVSARSSSFSSAASSNREPMAKDGGSTVRGRRLDLGARQLDESPEERKRLLDVLGPRRIVPIDDGLHRPRLEAAALGQLDQLEALASLDDDVEPPVLEPVGDLDDGRECPDLADALVVGVDEPERRLLVHALGDQLAVARLEDVQRDLLGREQDEPERKEADLVHPSSVKPPGRHPTGGLQDEAGDGREKTEDGDEPHAHDPGTAASGDPEHEVRDSSRTRQAWGMRASRAAPSASRTGWSSIRSSTSWKKPRTISRSASERGRPRAIR